MNRPLAFNHIRSGRRRKFSLLHGCSITFAFGPSELTLDHKQEGKERKAFGYYSHKAKSNLKGTRKFPFAVVFMTQYEYCNEVIKVPCICRIIFTISLSLSPSFRLSQLLEIKRRVKGRKKCWRCTNTLTVLPRLVWYRWKISPRGFVSFAFITEGRTTPSGCLICV